MTHGYVHGFRSQPREIAVESLPVQGDLPDWLGGTLIRNGPGTFELAGGRLRHWFDGFAMLHRFGIHDGAVSYANKFVDSPAHRAARATGRLGYREFGSDPCRSVFQRVLSAFVPATGDNTSINVTHLDNAFIAMTESPAPIEFDPDTLETLGRLRYHDDFPGHITTAHPHHDPFGDQLLNYTTRFGLTSTYNVYRIPSGTRRRQLIGAVNVRQPGYMHSFGMTEHYIILAEYPLTLDPLRLVLTDQSFAEVLEWQPEHPTRFIIMDKRDGRIVATREAEPFFCFHHVNAYEDNNAVIVDMAAYADDRIISALYLDNVPTMTTPPSHLRRFTLPLDGRGVEAVTLSDERFELPRIHYNRHNGTTYRYAYGTGINRATPDEFQNQLVKIDTRTGDARIWYEPGSYPGEPIFVASPAAGAEDDGVILSVVLDAPGDTSFLLVLNATDFTEMARAHVPLRIPFGFHGQFFG